MLPPTIRTVQDPDVPTTAALPRQPARILVADDEHLVASGMATNLAALGYEVVGPVPDGETAIERCRQDGPDMALLDIRMPHRDGLDAAGVIFGELSIPVVIFSAYSDPKYVDAGSRAGIFGYLLKPVTKEQLRAGISVAWSRYLDYAGKNEAIETLQDRLAQRRVIEQAKWIIVKRRGVDEPEAMRLLQKRARSNRRSMADVARSVIESDLLLGNDDEAGG